MRTVLASIFIPVQESCVSMNFKIIQAQFKESVFESVAEYLQVMVWISPNKMETSRLAEY